MLYADLPVMRDNPDAAHRSTLATRQVFLPRSDLDGTGRRSVGHAHSAWHCFIGLGEIHGSAGSGAVSQVSKQCGWSSTNNSQTTASSPGCLGVECDSSMGLMGFRKVSVLWANVGLGSCNDCLTSCV